MIIDQAIQLAFQKKEGIQTDEKNPEGFIPDAQGNVPFKLDYQPTDQEKAAINMVLDSFRIGYLNLTTPRRELNDMSILTRDTYVRLSFNIYQPNNGQSYDGDQFGSWKSNAMRPVVRNKVISVAAHATARMLFPKVFAWNEQSEIQEDAATVMRDLIEWAGDQCDYARYTMYAVINALVSPYSVMHVEYAESKRLIKTDKKADGTWNTKEVVDEENSGFLLTPVAVDELYYANVYVENIQRQEFLIWRRVNNYGAMRSKYGHYENFKYVKPGLQVIYNDANVAFYYVYDPNLAGDLCEEVIFWSRSLDLRLVLVNGVLLTPHDEPNPRLDKKYPFVAFGYENIDEGNMIIKKSLAFKMQPDADIINTLYPLIIDGTYLSIMPPLIIAGEETINSEVVIPGATTTLNNPESQVTPLKVSENLGQGMQALFNVEDSINKSSEQPLDKPGDQTAYGMSLLQQQAQTLLGPFVRMIASYVKQTGELLKSDILQYITLAQLNDIVDNPELIYRTIIVPDRRVDGGTKNRRIKFDPSLPTEISESEELEHSYDILEEQGGEDGNEELYKVNPMLFRKLKFMTAVSADVVTPMSEDLEKALGLELYDRAINNPYADQEQVTKDFLFGLYPKAKDNVSKYIKEPEPVDPTQQAMNAGEIGPDGKPLVNMGADPSLNQPVRVSSPITKAGRVSPMAAMRTNPLSNK